MLLSEDDDEVGVDDDGAYVDAMVSHGSIERSFALYC